MTEPNPNWRADPMSSLERIGRGTPAQGVYGNYPNGQQLARVARLHEQNAPGNPPTHDRHLYRHDGNGTVTMTQLDVRAGGWAELGGEPPNDDVRPGSPW